MATPVRCLTIIGAIVLLALIFTSTLFAAGSPTSVADQTLLNAANRDRAAAGLPPLQWDAALAAAAHEHAVRMAQMNTLSHQFPGEPPMQDRARRAGARFSMIAENVAEGPTVSGLHTQWMNSPPHRANLLDKELNSIGISVVQSANMLFAVEDFSVAVPLMTLESQEQQVESQLAARGLQLVEATSDARKTCESDRGWSGQRPAGVVRYETADVRRIPNEIDQRLSSGRYRSAAVGACEADASGDFARFRVAILLY